MALGFDELPVVAVAARTLAAAAEFPRKDVLKLDVDGRGAVVRRVLHSVLFGVLVLAWAQMISSQSRGLIVAVGLPDDRWIAHVLHIVLVLVTLAVVGMDEASVVSWEMFAAGGVVALVEILRTEPSAVSILLACGPLWTAAYFWRRLRLARRARWERLRQVLDDHRLVESEVIRHRWHSTSGSGPVHTLRLVLASSQLPGQRWDVQLSPGRGQIDAAPETGDRVLVFVCPRDPEVAVVRPVLPA